MTLGPAPAKKAAKGKKNEEDGSLEPMEDGYDLKEDDEELKNKIEDGTISSYSVAKLKDILKERKVKAGKGTKDGLVAELKKYLKI